MHGRGRGQQPTLSNDIKSAQHVLIAAYRLNQLKDEPPNGAAIGYEVRKAFEKDAASALYEKLRRLTEAGYLEGHDDGRGTRYTLTEKGLAEIESLKAWVLALDTGE